MDLLKTILIYMSMVFVSSVQNAPEPTIPPEVTVAPVAIVQTATPTPVATPTPTPVPTPNITPNAAYKTIKVGDRNDDVKEMQRRLAELGYYSGDLDGSFGNQTRRAVEKFQYNNGLKADGIAGKATLTVLYESDEVRVAPAEVAGGTPGPSQPPAGTAAPGATKTPGPVAARTLKPEDTTPAPTFMPIGSPTPEAADTSTEPVRPAVQTVEAGTPTPAAETTAPPPTDSPAPTETPQPLVPTPMEGYSFVLAGQTDQMTVPGPTAETGAAGEPVTLAPLQMGPDTVMVPFLKLLESAGVVIVPSVTDSHAEYAYPVGRDVYRLSYGISPEGEAINLAVYKNGKPQVMTQRMAVLLDGTLYLPLGTVQELTGITFTLSEENKAYTVTFPPEE